MNEVYQISSYKNAEICYRWCTLVIKQNLTDFYNNVDHFISIQGKQKYILPLYKQMMQSNE